MQAGDVQIVTVSGGVQNNVIPAEADALIWVHPDDAEAIKSAVQTLAADLKLQFPIADPDLRIGVRRSDKQFDRVLSGHAAARLVQIIALLPDSIQTQILAVPGNLETSNNIGLTVTTGKGFEITCTITSALTSRKHAVLDQLMMLADIAGDGVSAQQIGLDAPEFRWNPDSRMLVDCPDQRSPHLDSLMVLGVV